MPWAVITMYASRKQLQRNTSTVHGERLSGDGATAVEAYYFCPLLLACVALLVLRTLDMKADPCFKSWQFMGTLSTPDFLLLLLTRCHLLLLHVCIHACCHMSSATSDVMSLDCRAAALPDPEIIYRCLCYVLQTTCAWSSSPKACST